MNKFKKKKPFLSIPKFMSYLVLPKSKDKYTNNIYTQSDINNNFNISLEMKTDGIHMPCGKLARLLMLSLTTKLKYQYQMHKDNRLIWQLRSFRSMGFNNRSHLLNCINATTSKNYKTILEQLKALETTEFTVHHKKETFKFKVIENLNIATQIQFKITKEFYNYITKTGTKTIDVDQIELNKNSIHIDYCLLYLSNAKAYHYIENTNKTLKKLKQKLSICYANCLFKGVLSRILGTSLVLKKIADEAKNKKRRVIDAMTDIEFHAHMERKKSKFNQIYMKA